MKITQRIGIWISLLVLVLLAACSGEATPDPNAIKPSKPGDTGEALKLKGEPTNGEIIFNKKCIECHGEKGKGGVANGGTQDGTVPALNPIEPSLYNTNTKVFAANLDLFIEHGSVPEGTPHRTMLAYGDYGILKPQEIADVIAYIISLNTK